MTPAEVEAMFRQRFKRGPWPNKTDCYRLAIDITAVKYATPQPAKHSDKTFADRLAVFNDFRKLTSAQRKKVERASLGLRLPNLVVLETLEELLNQARDSLLFPYDPLAGVRAGSEWHKPVRYLAPGVEKAMKAAGRKIGSRDKRSAFVDAVCGALALAGQEERSPSAVAGVLARPPL